MSLLAETAARLRDSESASVLYRLLEPYARLNVADPLEGMRGSVARYLGLLETCWSAVMRPRGTSRRLWP